MFDEKDKKIFKELERDSRRTTKKIATTLNIPRVTVHDRIKKMVERGVIKKFTVIPDYEKIGKPAMALVFVSFNLSANISERALSSKMAKMPEIYEIYVISGEYDLLLKIRGKSVEDISRTVIDKIRSMGGVAKTFTCTCFETIKEKN